LPSAEGLGLEPLREAIGRHPAASPPAEPCPNRVGTDAIGEPGPLLDVPVGENLVENQIEILV
jgi:hypothetical protein